MAEDTTSRKMTTALSPTQKNLARIFSCSLMTVMFALTTLGFARFVHYHRQNTLLSPGDYTAELVTAEDYQKLSDPKVRRVKLASGEEIWKGDAFETTKYMPVDGGTRYLLVTLNGTAPMMPLLYSTLSFVLIPAVMGLCFTWVALRRLSREAAASV